LSNSVIRWLTTTPEDRQRDREVSVVDRRGDTAQAQVDNIGRVTTHAQLRALEINRTRQVAEYLAPDGAELYAMIAVAGTIAMTEVIGRMNRPGGYRL